MANYKKGLSYYNIDTDRYQDIKIKRLKKDFGCSGIAVYDYLLCNIYRDKGCFLAWDKSTAFDVADYFGLKEILIEEIVKYCGVVGLFDRELLTCGILTSSSIQKRYIEMCIRAKRSNFSIPKFAIIQEESNIILEESNIIQEESNIIQEVCRKVKKSKVNKSKEKEKNKKEKINFSFCDLNFLSVFQDWIDYKKSKGQSYKNQKSLETCYNHLLEISNNNPEIAKKIVMLSIANNWSGIYEIKDFNKQPIQLQENKSGGRDSIFEHNRKATESGLIKLREMRERRSQ